MKKRITLGLLLCCLFASMLSIPAFAATPTGKGEVVVYNWSEFIPQDVLENFTKETGIKVVYSTFESNEAMFAKVKLLRGKAYDVIFPSSYFVELMAQNKLIQPLDHARLPNIKNLDPSLMELPFDPQNTFSIPYMWGATGIAYNTKFIPKGSITKWADLLKPEFKGKIILTDDLRDAFGLAFRTTGHSVSSKDPKEIQDAYDFLMRLKASVRVFDVTAIKQALISEEVWLGPIWNGDFLVAQEENPDLDFVFPEEGAILWLDAFTISSGAPNLDNAYTFINYMLRPEVAKRCVEEYKYSTPNKATLDLLPEDLRQNAILVPTEKELKNGEFPADVGETLAVYEKYWEQLKTSK